MELSQYGELFLSESREHVSTINHLLLSLEADPGSRQVVEGVFRAVHTIKGMSATMGYRSVADLSHEMENLLDRIRQGRAQATPETIDLLFAACDALEKAIELAVEETGEEPRLESLLTQLRGAAGDDATFDIFAPQIDLGPGTEAEPEVEEGALRVRVQVAKEALLPGVRAFMALKRARELGEVSGIEPGEAALNEPDFDGAVRFVLRTESAADAVREALLAVGELGTVEVAEHRPDDVVRGDVAADASAEEGRAAAGAAGRARHIRVDLRRLDALMNQVGELVIARDRLRRLVGYETPELTETVDQASRLIGELQDEIMRARLAPVSQVFDRFPRLVRDAARALGKKVDFVIEGKEIELDRSMLDEIGDPLVHLLRNALDHGIEAPAERRAHGKPETGTLRLSASRERSRIIIRVEDDGRGVQRDRVLGKAVQAGLVARDEAAGLPDEEVYRLLTRPGFSTAETVTDVSGRGVGLDVVATRVRALGGMLEIWSEPGRGTSMTLQLPQTLAIVRALLVRQGGETYALPLTHVGETVHLLPDEVGTVKGRTVAFLRDEVIPLLALRQILHGRGQGTGDRGQQNGAKRHAVLLEVGEQRIGLEVDALMGQQEIVVKQFDATADTLRLFSGATILSDGRPALILDAGSVLAAANG
ncbi:MAG: chemotaxis protein CheW [Longimicrobiaceae bacterium]